MESQPQRVPRKETLLVKSDNSGIVFYNTGDVELNSEYNIMTMEESTRLGLVAFLVIGLLLAFFLRRSYL